MKGLLVDKDYDGTASPAFLLHDIKAYGNAAAKETDEKCYHIDCLSDEIYGSINAACWDGLITKEGDEHLREKFLGIEDISQDIYQRFV